MKTMPQANSANDKNPSLIPWRHYSLRANLKRRSLGTVFAHFMFVLFISMMAVTPALFMMMDSNFVVQGPQLHPDSFSVSNFNVLNSKLSATWQLDLAFVSQGDGYEILFSGIEGTIFYKEDIPLAVTSWQPFDPERKEHKNVHLKFVTSGWEGDQPVVENKVLKEMKEEQEKGMVHFSMRINTFVIHQKWGLLWRGSKPGHDSYCWDLMVKFAPETGAGRLFGGGPKECRINGQS